MGSTGVFERVERVGFDVVLLDVVCDVYRRGLGQVGAQTVFQYLERSCGLKLDMIPSDLEVFSSNMARLLGSTSQVLEDIVIKHLCRKLQLEYHADTELTFPDRVERLKKRFEELKK